VGKRKITLLVLGILLLGVAAIGVFTLSMWNKPLGPSLELPSLTPSTDSISPISDLSPLATEPRPDPTQVITSTQMATPDQSGTPRPSPTATSQPLCEGPETMTILVIGSDQRGTGYLYGLADSIHVVRIDFSKPDVMIIDFPRDLWVEIPDIASHHGITHGKLNQAYLFGNPGMGYYEGPGEGPGLLARTLDKNFGLRVDHYLAIDTQTFIRMIDAVGGVDIKVEIPIDLNWGSNTPDPRFYLSVGTRHLDGELALLLATNRVPSTFQRMIYQKMIMNALRDKLLTPGMIPELPGLVTRFITSVQTDLSMKDINSLLCIALEVTNENIKADSFPQEMFTASGIYDPYRKVTTFIYEADFDQIKAMVKDFMDGVWPFP